MKIGPSSYSGWKIKLPIVILKVAFLFLSNAKAQNPWISIEEFAVHNDEFNELNGYTTYRLYLNTNDSQHELLGLFANHEHPVLIASSDGFYQSPFGSTFGWQINPLLFSFAPAIEFDTWITQGASNSSELTMNGVGSTVISNEYFGNALWAFEQGNDLFSYGNLQDGFPNYPDFIIHQYYGHEESIPNEINQILIAQLTAPSTAEVYGYLNCQLSEEIYTGLTFSNSGNIPIGCSNSIACNHNALINPTYHIEAQCEYAGSCQYCSGAVDGTGFAVDFDGNGNGTCDDSEVFGCTNPNSCNFNPNATTDDQTCIEANWAESGTSLNGYYLKERLGWDVAVSSDGHTILASAPWYGFVTNELTFGLGRTLIYSKSESNSITTKGSPIVGGIGEYCGWSADLSADGNIVACGYPYADDEGTWSGKVKAFSWDSLNNTWLQLGQNLVGETQDVFGKSLALSSDGSTLAVGGFEEINLGGGYWSHNSDSLSYVKIYQWSNDSSQWIQKGETIFSESPFDGSPNSLSVTLNGDLIAIGEKAAGKVRVLEWSDSSLSWQQRGETIGIFPSLGQAVSLSEDGDVLIVSVLGMAITRFEWNSETASWHSVGDPILANPYESANSSFGMSLDISSDGNILVTSSNSNTKLFAYNALDSSWHWQWDIDFGEASSISPDGSMVTIGDYNFGYNEPGQVRQYEQISDTLILSCPEQVVGCKNPVACNYNPQATFDDLSCVFPHFGLDCEGSCLGPYYSSPDVNRDEITSIIDLITLLSFFGQSVSSLETSSSLYQPDCNCDGQVGVLDLMMILSGM